jgi:7,8-dihydropterin-6-yl-methyl-4-(beta-D-ribofuranosyl)aminobenzene 5'-phosphate synthase
MTIRITTLIENTAGWVNVLGEWGLSMLVETDDLTILSDTGTSEATARNARGLGVSLRNVDVVVISHGHFDHTGGLLDLLPLIGKPVDVMGHPDMWARKYAYHPGHKVCEYNTEANYEYIGIPFAREQAEKWGARFVLGSEPVWLSDTVVTSGEVPMRTEYETIDPALMVLENGEYKPDPLADDQSIFIKTDKGLVAVLGCAHRGVVNHLLRGQELTGIDKVYAVIGGTHLGPASRDRIDKTIRELRRMEVQKVAASHCTGLKAACALDHEFGDSFVFNNAGTRITL